ncbi:ABC transporter permease [Corynebacterium lowii]|uniref:ABC-2 family transporter protein n=1 Tax=Corynebacterium lowii TaxID=1544413 RepID=A0A0Q0U546_9CORY|nr:ABC transporter permease [Corynebacterium lowii]KQB87070.1 hypothetical protein Clow_00117 [Corynebacterium lowii]MDP9852346.1 hypothetical protein [Corynebacterium lowii]
MTTENASTAEAQKDNKTTLKFIATLLGVPLVLLIMLLSFLLPSLNSGAKDLPLAVSGPEPVIQQITGGLEQKQPDAFDVTTYQSAEEARDSVLNRDNIGAITVGDNGITIITASGAGTPYASLLQQLGTGLESTEQQVSYDDVAPLTEDDPTGSSIATLGLPLVFGGNVSAILLISLFKNSPRLRVLGGLAIAIIGGFAVTAVMQYSLHVIDGNFLLTAAVLSLGIASISMTLQGLHNLAGMAGIGVAGVILLFFSNPLSGLATGAAWLPSPWGLIGQLMPIGAAGTAIRSAAFFDGAGMTFSLTVLIAWTLAGFLLSAFITKRQSK